MLATLQGDVTLRYTGVHKMLDTETWRYCNCRGMKRVNSIGRVSEYRVSLNGA